MVGKREKRFCPKNVRLALVKLRVLGQREPLVWDEAGRGLKIIPFSAASPELQRVHWYMVLDVLRQCYSRQNAEKWREKNRERT